MGLGNKLRTFAKASILSSALALSSCVSYPNSDVRKVFDEISVPYIVDYHDCDDMSQEFSDYLVHDKSVDSEDLRFVECINKDSGVHHMFLQWYIFSEWRSFDPARKIFDAPGDLYLKKYDFEGFVSVSKPFRDGSGYNDSGDYFVFDGILGSYKNRFSVSGDD